jgi:voltage-gated potassium channel
VIDARAEAVEEARRAGHAGVVADASASASLEAAGVREAAAVIVAPDRDDSAVLITLTARELNPRARIVASVREGENAHLLEQGGADSVVVSSGAAGRLLGHAVKSPRVVQVLEDLLSVGAGLDVIEREATQEEVGVRLGSVPASAPIIAVARGEAVLRFDDPRVGELRPGDRLVCLCSNAS